MDGRKRRRWPTVLIVVAVCCLALAPFAYLFAGYLAFRAATSDWDFSGFDLSPPSFMTTTIFVFEYLAYVDAKSECGIDVAHWYAPGVVRPDTGPGRLSLGLPPESDEAEAMRFLEALGITVDMNLEDGLSKEEFSDVAGIFERVSGPDEPAVFVYPPRSLAENDDDQTYGGWPPPYTLRHNPALGKDDAVLTFELQGTDTASGAPIRERHTVHFVRDPQHARCGLPFLITSHTVEELPVDEAE